MKTALFVLLAACAAKEEPPRTDDELRTACKVSRDRPACYELGTRLVYSDPLEAADLLSRACHGKVEGACLDLGVRYLKGRGFPQDYGAASLYLDIGCYQLDMTACAQGGVAAWYVGDPRTAKRLLDVGCEAKVPDACQDLAVVLAGTPIPEDRDLKRSAAMFEKACGLAMPESCYATGLHLHRGDVVPADPARARLAWVAGCELGSFRSCDALREPPPL